MHAAAIRKLVVTTDSLFVKLLLRDGGDSIELLCWRCASGERDCDCYVSDGYLQARSVCGQSTAMYWVTEVMGGCNYRERSEYV